MSIKRVWTGTLSRVFQGLNYKYEDGKYVEARSRVFLLVKVSEGKETGRLVRVELTPEEAEQKAAELIKAAKDSRERGFRS